MVIVAVISSRGGTKRLTDDAQIAAVVRSYGAETPEKS
jgi:hypothetical protein